MAQESIKLPEGTLLDNGCFKIQRYLGKGGFGITYLALEVGIEVNIGDGESEVRTVSTPERVVIKELYYDEFCSRDAETNFITISRLDKKVEFEKLVNKQIEEGRNQRKLTHQYIVRNKKIFKDNGTAYIVMEYLQGTDLEELLNSTGRLSVDRSVKYIRQILEALDHVHRQKILHLDIKPSNIFIKKDTDDAVLIDFGAALSYDDHGKVNSTTSKLISGVSFYAPPEQRSLEGLMERNNTLDTFSLTGTFYHCITGQKPVEAVNRVAFDNLVLPSDLNIGISDYYDAFMIKGLSLPFRNRFQSAAEFAGALANAELYEKCLKQAHHLFISRQYDGAMEQIAKATELLGPTKSINELDKKCKDAQKEEQALKKYHRHFNEGLKFEEQGDFKSALKEYNLANNILPSKNEAILKINICNKRIEALENESKVRQFLHQAVELKTKEDFDGAEVALRNALLIEPGNKEAAGLVNEITTLRIEKKRHEEFITSFQEYKDQKNNLVSSMDFEKALDLLYRAQKIYPENDEVRNEISLIELQYKRHKEGLDIQSKLVIGDTYYKNEQWIEAINEYERILRIYPISPNADSIRTKIEDCKRFKSKREETRLLDGRRESKAEQAVNVEPQELLNNLPEPAKTGKRKYQTRILILSGVLILLFLGIKAINGFKNSAVGITDLGVTTDSNQLPVNKYDTTALNQPDTAISQPSLANLKTDEDEWKKIFDQEFKRIYTKEISQQPVPQPTVIDEYRALLKKLPQAAIGERKKINDRISHIEAVLENNRIEEKLREEKMKRAYDLSEEADKLFKQKPEEALSKYLKANEIWAGAGDTGYDKFLNWGKQQFVNFGECDGCKVENLCKNFVIDKMKKALQIKPSGKEAVSILNCLK